MSEDRAYNMKAYADAFEKMKTDCDQDLTIAFVAEGDISFYSTFIHLLGHIHAERLPVEIIAGVPSFLAAAAAHAQPLATLQEKVAIIPLLRGDSCGLWRLPAPVPDGGADQIKTCHEPRTAHRTGRHGHPAV